MIYEALSLTNALEEQIAETRRDNWNGTVVYDLTNGIDFSHPKETASALAEVIFEIDVSKWFSGTGKDLKVNPTSKIEIHIQDAHRKAIEKMIGDFQKDLKYDEIKKNFQAQFDAYGNEERMAKTIHTYLGNYFLGVAGQFADQQVTVEIAEAELLHKLMVVVVANIKVVSV